MRVCLFACMLIHIQRTAGRSQSSPSTMWAPGIELRSVGLVASVFTHGAISPAPKLFYEAVVTKAHQLV